MARTFRASGSKSPVVTLFPAQNAGAVISLTFPTVTILESAAIGSTIGALSVVNGFGTWTFTETADPDGKVSVASDGNVTMTAGLDFETKTTHSFSASATNGFITLNVNASFNVGNVLEGALAPTTANMAIGAAQGTLVATVSGLDVGANETVTGVNDTRFVVASGNRIQASAVATTVAGTINLTVMTSAGRQLALAVAVAAAANGALALSARSIPASAAPASLVGAISGLRSGSAISVATGSPFIAVSGTDLVRGTRGYRAGYHNVVLRDTASDGSTIDTTLTLKSPRDSRTVCNFSDLSNWVHGDAARVSQNSNWSSDGPRSLRQAFFYAAKFTGSVDGNVLTVTEVASGTLAVGDTVTATGVTNATTISAQTSGTAGGAGTYTLSRTLGSPVASTSMTTMKLTTLTSTSPANFTNFEFGMDKIYAIDVFIEGPETPSNIAVRFFNAAGATVTYNLNTYSDHRLGAQTVAFCGKHMTGASASFGNVTKISVLLNCFQNLPSAVSYGAIRENAGEQAGFINGMDDGYDDWEAYTNMLTTRGLARPYLALQVSIIDANNPDEPRLTMAKLQSMVAAGSEVINHSTTHPNLAALYDLVYGKTSGTDAEKAAAAEAVVIAEVQGCIDYTEGRQATVMSYYGTNGAERTTPVQLTFGPTNVDISKRTIGTRRVRSSMSHMVLPGGTFLTANSNGQGVINALRKMDMVTATGVLSGGWGSKDGLLTGFPMPRRSFNLASSNAAGIRAILRWLQYIVDTKQIGEGYIHTLGKRTSTALNPDGVAEGVQSGTPSTQVWALTKILDGWVAEDGVTPLKGLAQHVAEGALSLGRTEAYERTTPRLTRGSGFNLAGADFSGALDGDPKLDFAEYKASPLPSNPEVDSSTGQALRGNEKLSYVWPKKADIDLIADMGATDLRLPIRYHHLYNVVSLTDPTLDTERAWDMARFVEVLGWAQARGLIVIVEDHQYGFKSLKADPGSTTASDFTADKFFQDTAADKALFAGRWRRIAAKIKAFPVRYGLMNEPTAKVVNGVAMAPSTVGLFNLYQAAMDAVAAEDPNPAHVFHINGNHYASPDAFTKLNGQASSSAIEFLRLVDPRGGKPIAEVHVYLDADTRNGGANIAGSHPGKEENPVILDFADSPATLTFNGTTYPYQPAVRELTNWARANNAKLYCGEFAVKSEEPIYVQEGDRLLRVFSNNRDVWDGWTYWGAGAWWPDPSRPSTEALKVFSPLPLNRASLVNRGAMNMLTRYMPIGA